MTRIDFHFNLVDRLDYACRLARKIVRSGERATFWCADTALLAQWDTQLWSFSPVEFVPHVSADDPLAADTPIILSSSGIDRPDRSILVSLLGQGSEPAAHFSRYQRLIELVSTDSADRSAARDRWRFYRDRGYPIHTHEAGTPRPA
jgi:DNA polymerase-3 subunit chi